jgi:hypothetical protein
LPVAGEIPLASDRRGELSVVLMIADIEPEAQARDETHIPRLRFGLNVDDASSTANLFERGENSLASRPASD